MLAQSVAKNRLQCLMPCSVLQVDVYAWAMVCYELFEGKIPFQGEKPIAAARRAAMEQARPAFAAQNRCARGPAVALPQPQ